MGHVLQLRREGIRASAPVFIPFLGAAIAMKEMPKDAAMEARVGLAGPILGTIGALATYLAALALDSDLLMALAFTAFFLNLFNLLPVSPLDGGRAMAAVSPIGWLFGLGVMIALVIVRPNPVLLLIAVLAGFETWKRWRDRHEQSAYYESVTQPQRLAFFASWLGLIVLLAVLMDLSHLERTL
jgi:Zn-dependent protease